MYSNPTYTTVLSINDVVIKAMKFAICKSNLDFNFSKTIILERRDTKIAVYEINIIKLKFCHLRTQHNTVHVIKLYIASFLP
ncbi:hypothetical protein [Wolbachia endosymbiont of Atemnus politus]|uniref:hypothetical protein n=1 Tax=Wolbachia endosymbiont of Atemnus politus TaxID=2682840 RepID=UPI0015725EBC|nr:hypothetical protein [Wolbachia endosymbiont of Atemnus politus]